PSLLSVWNEAVVSFNWDATLVNARMMRDHATGLATGVILVNAGDDQAWPTLMTLSTLGHEWAHGVFSADVGNTVPYPGGESGGLDEANSDFFGKLIKAYGQAG